MIVIIKDMLFLMITTAFLTSCSILRTGKCTLDYETNTISGNTSGQKEFYRPSYNIKCSIEELIGNTKCSVAVSHESLKRRSSQIFARYHIYGCKDTTWAKRAMADHLMNKYHISREDSTYLDTVLLLTVIDESKLDRVEDDCSVVGVGTLPYAEEPHSHYTCFRWFGRGFLPHEYSSRHRSISVDYKPRPGKYNYKTPLYVVEQQGLEAYSDILLERYGVTLTWDRVDTVTVPVYKYVK